jgi:hypothetical protein
MVPECGIVLSGAHIPAAGMAVKPDALKGKITALINALQSTIRVKAL